MFFWVYHNLYYVVGHTFHCVESVWPMDYSVSLKTDLNFLPCSKFVIDALPMVGTGEAVKLMKNLISNEDVTGADADMWLASLAFIHHPTGEMIKEIRVTYTEDPRYNDDILRFYRF